MGRIAVSSKGVARRAAILRTAYDVLADGGYARSSLRGIAKAAGLEPAHVLYYFGTRENLLCEVIAAWDDENGAAQQEGDDGLDVLLSTVARNRRQPGIVHVYLTLAAEAVDPSHPAHGFFERRVDRVRAQLVEAIEARQRTHRMRSDLEPVTTARTLIAVADGMQLQSLIDPAVDAYRALSASIASLSPSPAA